MDAFFNIVKYVQEHGQAPSTPEEMKQVMDGASTYRILGVPFFAQGNI